MAHTHTGCTASPVTHLRRDVRATLLSLAGSPPASILRRPGLLGDVFSVQVDWLTEGANGEPRGARGDGGEGETVDARAENRGLGSGLLLLLWPRRTHTTTVGASPPAVHAAGGRLARSSVCSGAV